MNRSKLRRVAIAVAILLCIASLIWPKVQGVATILLLLVTLEYVLLTQENIELFRRQLERQEKVYLTLERWPPRRGGCMSLKLPQRAPV